MNIYTYIHHVSYIIYYINACEIYVYIYVCEYIYIYTTTHPQVCNTRHTLDAGDAVVDEFLLHLLRNYRRQVGAVLEEKWRRGQPVVAHTAVHTLACTARETQMLRIGPRTLSGKRTYRSTWAGQHQTRPPGDRQTSLASETAQPSQGPHSACRFTHLCGPRNWPPTENLCVTQRRECRLAHVVLPTWMPENAISCQLCISGELGYPK